VWWALGDPEGALTRSATVLIIACPHALGLAIPLVIAISTSSGARNGPLVKDRLALERARELDLVVFDKTGTLTLADERGRPARTCPARAQAGWMTGRRRTAAARAGVTLPAGSARAAGPPSN
jgi:Cu2+-exporting ATPase